MTDGFERLERRIMSDMAGDLAGRMCIPPDPCAMARSAFHEAGHCVLSRYNGISPIRAELGEDGSGCVYFQESDVCPTLAEAIESSVPDQAQIVEHAQMLTAGGRPPDLAELERRTAEILRDHWGNVCRIARALYEHRVLTGAELEELYAPWWE